MVVLFSIRTPRNIRILTEEQSFRLGNKSSMVRLQASVGD